MNRPHHSPAVVGRYRSLRRGSILTWFAVFLFALLPLMTLVVHVGMVTLTRRQMQAAVNTAAIEGLRFRNDASLTEAERREQARELVSAVYDDTLDTLDTSDGDALRLGAGPVISFDDEPTDISLPGTDFKAARTVRRANIGVYDPVLELNESNEVHGDMLRGTYTSGVAHTEDNDYTRSDDFNPEANGDAFLVRLRRTDNVSDLDSQFGVSSHGPPVPFLFGRGPYGGREFLNQRERGTIVRATAIAHAVPALTVGPYSPDAEFGAAPIWVEQTQWDSLVTDASGNLSISGSTLLVSGLTPLGEFVAPQVVAVGDSLVTAVPAQISGERFVPIYRVLTSGNRYVIGFGLAEFAIDPVTGGTITRRSSSIGQGNCSAHWRANLASVPAGDLSELLAARNSQAEPLLAPALVRSID